MTQMCDFKDVPWPLHRYSHATDIKLDDDLYGVVLRRDSRVTFAPVVFKSHNKFDVRLAIREANEILSAIHRLRRDSNAQ